MEAGRGHYLGYLWLGYQDAQEGTPYHRAPVPDCDPMRVPELQVPDEMLPDDWRGYLDGWKAGVKDKAARAIRRAEREREAAR